MWVPENATQVQPYFHDLCMETISVPPSYLTSGHSQLTPSKAPLSPFPQLDPHRLASTYHVFLHPHLMLSCLFPSTRQDDFFILQEEAADSFLESIFKTEFVSLLSKRFEEAARRPLPLTFSDVYAPQSIATLYPTYGQCSLPTSGTSAQWFVEKGPQLVHPNTFFSLRLQFRVKKEGWGGGSTRNVTFCRGTGDLAVLKAGGRALTISIGDGLPKSTSKEPELGNVGAGPGAWSLKTKQLCGGKTN